MDRWARPPNTKGDFTSAKSATAEALGRRLDGERQRGFRLGVENRCARVIAEFGEPVLTVGEEDIDDSEITTVAPTARQHLRRMGQPCDAATFRVRASATT